MKFRYKVECNHNCIFNCTRYDVKIQRFHKLFMFHWHTVDNVELRYILYRLNKNAFNDFTYLEYAPEEFIYNELSKYTSMDELIMKYVTNVVLEKFKEREKNKKCDDLICEFVLTDNWKTIEIKENEN